MELRKTFVTRLDDQDVKAVVVRDGAGRVWVETARGEAITDALVLDRGRTVSIRHGGRIYLVDITPPGVARRAALIQGRGGQIQVLDELAAAAAEQAAAAGMLHPEVQADMPGVVVQIKCRQGESVRAGQPLVILEAMKMQNELPSPGDGVVESILVQEGASVDSGQVLVRLAPPEATD